MHARSVMRVVGGQAAVGLREEAARHIPVAAEAPTVAAASRLAAHTYVAGAPAAAAVASPPEDTAAAAAATAAAHVQHENTGAGVWTGPQASPRGAAGRH